MNIEARYVTDLAIVCACLGVYAVNSLAGMGLACIAFIVKGAMT